MKKTTEQLIAEIRQSFGVPETLAEPRRVRIGHLLSLTNEGQRGKWLIQDVLRPGSVNLLAINHRYACEKFELLAMRSVLRDQPFFGRQVRQGAVLRYEGGEAIVTLGKLRYRRTMEDDPNYVPFQTPIPPDCGLVKDLIRSGVKMMSWKSDPEDHWRNGAPNLLKRFEYITETESAAIIYPAPTSQPLGLWTYTRILRPGQKLRMVRLSLKFSPDGACTLGCGEVQDLQERLDDARHLPEPDEAVTEPDEVDHIAWWHEGAKTAKLFWNHADGYQEIDMDMGDMAGPVQPR